MRCPECGAWTPSPTDTERNAFGIVEFEQWTCDGCNCGWLMNYTCAGMTVDEHGSYFKKHNGKELVP